LYREFAAANARRRNEANRDARLAYLAVAMWATATTKHRLPPLDRYLIPRDPAPAGPEAQAAKLRSALHVLSAQYGIPLRPYRKEESSDGK